MPSEDRSYMYPTEEVYVISERTTFDYAVYGRGSVSSPAEPKFVIGRKADADFLVNWLNQRSQRRPMTCSDTRCESTFCPVHAEGGGWISRSYTMHAAGLGSLTSLMGAFEIEEERR